MAEESDHSYIPIVRKEVLYRDFSAFLADHFDGKVQKLAVNAGFSCPNRDGTIGRGGCSYCDNRTFNPPYCSHDLSVTEQLSRGRDFFARKYPEMKYLAYFQAYTNTHGSSPHLLSLYREALYAPDIVGLIIGTRPDCVPQRLLEEIKAIADDKFVMMEYGAESANDETLRIVNRGHSWKQTADAVRRTVALGIPVGLHLIMGLPGETREMMLQTIDAVNELPISTIKIHQLQIVKGTKLARQIEDGSLSVIQFSADSYADLCCDILCKLRPDIAIERFVSQAPAEMIISPKWGLKNYQFTDLLIRKLRQRRDQCHQL